MDPEYKYSISVQGLHKQHDSGTWVTPYKRGTKRASIWHIP